MAIVIFGHVMYILCSYWLFHFRFGGSKDKQTTLALPISARTLPYHPIFVATVQCPHYAQLPPGSLGVFFANNGNGDGIFGQTLGFQRGSNLSLLFCFGFGRRKTEELRQTWNSSIRLHCPSRGI